MIVEEKKNLITPSSTACGKPKGPVPPAWNFGLKTRRDHKKGNSLKEIAGGGCSGTNDHAKKKETTHRTV